MRWRGLISIIIVLGMPHVLASPERTAEGPAIGTADRALGNTAGVGVTNEAGASGSSNDLLTAAGVPVVNWRQVMRPEYTNYLAKLRAAGCPEEHVREITVSDLNEFFDRKRLQDAIQNDFEWWKTIRSAQLATVLADAQNRLDAMRERVLIRLLGKEAAGSIKLPTLGQGSSFSLTGPVLGAMPLAKFCAVSEICLRAEERLREAQRAAFAQAQPPDPTEEARLRQQTRAELARHLDAREMEEFLLRNSHDAEVLRDSLRGFNATADEFRAIFRAIDPIQHQMQLDYGSEAALSPRQREDHQKQCSRAVQEVLPPERFKQFLLTRDPAYQHAQADVAMWALGDSLVPVLYDYYRQQALKREQVLKNDALSPVKKNEALQAITREEQQHLFEIVQARNKPK